jgi:hypothetical protein
MTNQTFRRDLDAASGYQELLVPALMRKMKADSLADLVNMAATLHLPALQQPGPRLKGIGKRQHLSE